MYYRVFFRTKSYTEWSLTPALKWLTDWSLVLQTILFAFSFSFTVKQRGITLQYDILWLKNQDSFFWNREDKDHGTLEKSHLAILLSINSTVLPPKIFSIIKYFINFFKVTLEAKKKLWVPCPGGTLWDLGHTANPWQITFLFWVHGPADYVWINTFWKENRQRWT